MDKLSPYKMNMQYMRYVENTMNIEKREKEGKQWSKSQKPES